MKSLFLSVIFGVLAASANYQYGGIPVGWGGPSGHISQESGMDFRGSRGGWDPRGFGRQLVPIPSTGCPAPQCEESKDPCKLSAEENKKITLDFYNQVFLRQNYSAVDTYYAPNLIQHNPYVGDGKKPFYDYISTSKPVPAQIFRPVAECDLVYLHVKTEDENNKPTAVADIFRLECGKIVEHWDIIQEFPAESANSHPMF